MKRAGIRWWVMIVVVWAGGVGASEVALKVKTDRVNLRARPAYESEVVCQAQTGDLLIPLAEQGEWRGVRPPATAPVWIHSAFVTNEQITSRLNVRGGPGINFSSLGVLLKGDAVKVRLTRGDWLQIEAPTSTVLWVHKDYVTAQDHLVAPAPELAPMPVSTPDSNAVLIAEASPPPVTLPVKVPAPPELSAKGLKPEIQQGVRKVWEGQVQPIDFLFNRPGNYRLVKAGGEGRAITVCYLKGNDAQLSAFVGRKVQVSGWEYWLDQTDLPVIVPETIAPLP